MKNTKGFLIAAMLAASAALSACGGGGGGGGSTASTSSTTNTTVAVNATPLVPAAYVPTTTPVAPPPSNVANQVPVTVASDAALGSLNRAFVSVTVCAPGTTTCQTVNNVAVDTGSTGLRLYASALNSQTLAALPAVPTASGAPSAECAETMTALFWGSVRSADVKLAGEVAASLPIQILQDPAYAEPASCPTTEVAATPADIGANGILGVSSYRQDCGPGCASGYYVCSGSTCSPQGTVTSAQVSNPVASFLQDYNGTIITLPNVPAMGAPQVTGTLTFGLDTQADNSATNIGGRYYNAPPSSGQLVGSAASSTFPIVLTTGANAYYFSGKLLPTTPQCTLTSPLFYCQGGDNWPVPTPGATSYTPLSVSFYTSVTAPNGSTSTLTVTAANADQMMAVTSPSMTEPGAGSNFAYNDLAANSDTLPLIAGKFTLGLPFYLGRSVGTVLEGAAFSGGMGPGVQF